MKIKPYGRYIVICRGTDNKDYRWNLEVKPGRKAWNIINEEIKVGGVYKGFLILSTDDVTENFEPMSYREYIDILRSVNTHNSGCQICGGMIVNDRCIDCMFDWDS